MIKDIRSYLYSLRHAVLLVHVLWEQRANAKLANVHTKGLNRICMAAAGR
jgi:hypothetical protein